jgi:protein-L-isoaspartate(D-aspartate) O-methyltransferase
MHIECSEGNQRFAERDRMVMTQLEHRGIRDGRVLAAMRTVPRERFVPSDLQSQAYHDCALPIASGQTISQPYMVARMTELLEVRRDDRVLEIGTGSGYQAAVLAQMGARVWTIERHAELLETARATLESLGYTSVTYRVGDGSLGWAEEAPFDAVLLTAGAPSVPATAEEQLAVGGRLVAPIGPEDEQTLVLVRRSESGFEQRSVMQCRFVKMIGEEGWSR